MKWKASRKVDSWITAIAGILSVLFFYMSMCFMTISSEYKVNVFLFFTGILAVVMYIYCICRCVESRFASISELLCINSFFTFAGSAVLLSDCGILSVTDGNGILLIEIIWCMILLGMEIFLIKKGRVQNAFGKACLWKMVCRYKWGILLFILLVILAIDSHEIQFKWDGLLYYQTCCNLDIHSLSNLAIYGHIAHTFGAMVQIGILLFKDTAFSMMFMNILLLLCSSIAFYGIIRKIVPGRAELQYTVGTAIYAFSPFLLGMVNYFNLDYYCLCFFTIVFFCACSKHWAAFFVTSLLFCFTKEPAVIAYGGLCIGILLSDVLGRTKSSLMETVVQILQNPKYYMMTLPGILWLSTYFLLGPWSAGNGGFSFDVHYIVEKLKVLYVLNFNWVFTLLLAAGVLRVVCFKNKHWSDYKWLIWLLCSLLCFTIFSCMFQTVNHPRYSDIVPACMYIAGTLILLSSSFRTAQNAVMGILAVLMLISSFYTLDIISRSVFDTVNVGDTIMVVPQKNPPGDGMIYNKQILYFEDALNKALKNPVEQDQVIIFPAIEGSNYNFDGMAPLLMVSSGYRYAIEYWEEKNEKRSPEVCEHAIPVQINYIVDLDGIATLMDEEGNEERTFCYFYLPFAGKDIVDEIRDKYSIVEESEYSSGGWHVGRIVFGGQK